ncbi:hypothetical protein A3B87_02580 [Candidatus Kuenenbacteria bacterium RIFCSPHIGHO2_02_FULL_39_13]|uniref:Phosphoribosyltransferase domain-containing protein n=1 Tax=Candidatus Kuenenbacteria bacterium RIFCSPHIGHO2_02_FULL_39_13 TaxID=1798561 RepID=A0A1F6FLI4_9BACT|nr:MAG: hypothetical protein A3B87_02580 [Candidatus Kuenenbacteria bacterium RIFCSPHIGHO2_02_FULL_39_13]
MIKLYWRKIYKFFLDILFPIECVGCGQEDLWLCEQCLATIKLKEIDSCPACKKISSFGKTHSWCREQTSLDGMIVAASFDNKLLRNTIHKYKYNFIKELATPLSMILINKIMELDKKEDKPNWVNLLFSSDLILLPIPLHKRRLRWRDFNQAEMLSKKLAGNFYLNHRPYILKRKRYTTAQTELKREQRFDNIKNAFQVTKEWQDKLKNAKILLVDDVATTGATLNECGRTLKERGAREVWGLVLARG